MSSPLLRQIFLFGIIGVISAGLDFLVFVGLFRFIDINEYVCNAVSVHIGIAVNFTLNRAWNFKKLDRVGYRLVTFYAIGLFGLVLAQGILWLGNMIEFSVILSKAVSLVVVACTQFVLKKYISFR